MNGSMEWGVVVANRGLLFAGLLTSLELTAVVIALSLPLGCLIAIGRLSSRRWLSRGCGWFVNILRSNPLVLILFWFVFSIPLITGRPLGDFTSIIIAFAAFFSVYFAEIVRSGIQSVGANQVSAGLSTGLTHAQTMRHIVLPQALRAMLPPLTTQFIVVFQGTTVAYVIGYDELLHTTSMIAERTVRPVELYVAAALIYFVICGAGSLLARILERRLAS